ncbi:hypothetical protein JCM10212_007103 [Sporobolomyces blumeae]
MLTSVALPVAVAALASMSSVAAFSPSHGHLPAHRSFKRFVAPKVARDRVSRMVRRVKRGSDKTYSTTAIWYAETGWVGACGESFTDDDMIIALPLELYPKTDEASYLCGEKVTVTNDATGASITATVADASQRADFTIFTKAGYQALGGDLDEGELSVTYKFADSSPSVSSALPDSFSTSAVAGANDAQSTVKASATTSITVAAQVTSAAKNLAAAATPKPTTTTTTTTSAAPAATSSASTDEEDDDDWVCEDEAEDSSDDSSDSSAASSSWTSSTSTPAQTTQAAKQTTTQAPQTTTTTTSSAAASTSSKVYDSSSTSTSLLSAAGIKSFLGLNTGAIASWYHASSSQDSTNGHSWCYFPYNDNTPGFAISLKTMLANYGGDAMAARKAYCGLEAVVTTPDGTSSTLVVADAFDDTWVRTPTSIDVMYNAFTKLFGSQTSNKNDVIQGVTWEFTGNRNSQYVFNGEGN